MADSTDDDGLSQAGPAETGLAETSSAETARASGAARPMRADARRNRALVLNAAIAAFAKAGLAVPVHEIARQAGVGTGTVSRHFPTKDDLFEAIVLERVERLLVHAKESAAVLDPGPAFFEFFGALVREGALNRGLSQALAGVGYDMEAAALRAGLDFGGALQGLLAAAQQAGAVSADVEVDDVKALMAGCLNRANADEAAQERMIRIVCEGLRPGT